MATRRERTRRGDGHTWRERRVNERKRHSCMGRTLSAFERHEVAHPYCQGLFTQFLHSFMKSVIVAS